MSEIEAWTVELTRLADTAAGAVRAINHATLTGTALPAPCVYEVLGAAKRIGYGLEQATAQLAARLADSAAVFDLYECDDGDPAASIAAATAALTEASGHGGALGRLLDAAQSAIARQGYNP